MKKLLAIILTLVMILSIVPFSMVAVSAEEETTSGTTGDCTWTIEGTTLTISGNGKMADYDWWDNSAPWDVHIENIIINEGVTYIGDYAFYLCYMNSITIPSTVKSVGDYVFDNCYCLESIEFPEGVETLGSDLFNFCSNLTSVKISKTVKTIPAGIFEGCDNLTKIEVDAQNPYYSSKNGVLYNKGFTKLIAYPGGIKGKYTVPSTVTAIGERAFSYAWNLTGVSIGKNVTKIGYNAFLACKSLKNIYVNADNQKYSSKNGVLFNKKQTNLIVFPCGREGTYTVPEGVTTIYDYAFAICESMKSIKLPNTLKKISKYSFYACNSLQSITIPGSVDIIESDSFYFCNMLSKVVIHHGLETISSSAFAYNFSLKTVVLPKSIKKIEFGAFNGCDNIQNVYYCGTVVDELNGIKIEDGNDTFYNTVWKYEYCPHDYKTLTTTKATLSKNGKISRKCLICRETDNTTIKYAKTFKLSTEKYTYNGKVRKPTVTVKDSAGKTISSKYYDVKYASGRKNVGKYKVTVTMKGKYTGTKTLYFKINPPKTEVSKLTAGKKSLKVKIKKQSTQTSGYEIEYSTSKSFKKKYTDDKTVKGYKNTSTTLKKLKAKKTYYVRVRTYKTVDGKKYYSSWSSIKSKKTK